LKAVSEVAVPDVHQSKIVAFAEQILEQAREAKHGGRKRPYRLLRSVLKACGYEKQSKKALAAIQKALEDRGVQPEPSLIRRSVRASDPIRFTLVAERSPEARFTFPDDDSLRDFILQHLSSFPELSSYRPVKKEFQLDSGRRVDIFCRERGTERAVVIEVEKESAETVEQLLKYLDELDAGRNPRDLPALGIIISGRAYDVMQREFQSQSDRLRWFTYKATVVLEQYG
jgi:hypothetical protein